MPLKIIRNDITKVSADAIVNTANPKPIYFKYVPKIEDGGRDFATDLNLSECLKCIGYEDVLHVRYPELFFTNLIPGYRKGAKSTGGFKAD